MHDRLKLFFDLLNWIKNGENLNTTGEIDSKLLQMAISQKQETEKFFTTSIDQIAFRSSDHQKIRKLIIDIYSTLKTLALQMKSNTDVFSLTNDALDEMIRSFGFPYPDKLYTSQRKALFLLELINIYKQKGTPIILYKVLQYFGMTDISISEWWIKKNLKNLDYYAESKPIIPRTDRNNKLKRFSVPYESLIYGDPLWQLSREELQELDENEVIKLPSLTPYIGISNNITTNNFDKAMAILSKLCEEDLSFWISKVPKWNNIFYVESIVKTIPTNPVENINYIIINGTEFDYSVIYWENGKWMSYKLQKYDVIYDESDLKIKIFNGYEFVTIPLNITIDNNIYPPTSTIPSSISPGDKFLIGLKDKNIRNSKWGDHKGIAIWDGTIWAFQNPKINEIILGKKLDGVYIWNGKIWEKYTETTKQLYEPIYLTTYGCWVSVLVACLLICYIFNGPKVPRIDKRFLQYINEIDKSDEFGNRDGIYDANDVKIIADYYDDLNKRPKTRDERDEKYKIKNSTFSNDIYNSEVTNWASYSELYLKLINPDLLNLVNDLLEKSDKVTIGKEFNILLEDLDGYLIYDLNIMETPLSLIVNPTPLLLDIYDVIDFFKPYRVRIKDIIIIYDFKNTLDDSILLKDTFFRKYLTEFVDKGAYPFDDNLMTDYVVKSLHLSPFKSKITYENFDDSMKDIFISQIEKGLFDKYTSFKDFLLIGYIYNFFEKGPYTFDNAIIRDEITISHTPICIEKFNILMKELTKFFISYVKKSNMRISDELSINRNILLTDKNILSLDTGMYKDNIILNLKKNIDSTCRNTLSDKLVIEKIFI